MRKIILILLPLVLWLVPAALAEAGAAGPVIRVGLWSGQPNIIIAADSEFSLIDRDSREVLGAYRAKEKVAVSARNSGLAVNGKTVAAREIAVLLPENTPAFIEVNRRTYRGAISIRRTVGKNGLTVVNTLPLEEYVYGVIAREVSADWPLEALKAQAVAARTLAVSNLRM